MLLDNHLGSPTATQLGMTFISDLTTIRWSVCRYVTWTMDLSGNSFILQKSIFVQLIFVDMKQSEPRTPVGVRFQVHVLNPTGINVEQM